MIARDLLRVGRQAFWLFASLVAFKTALFFVGVMIARFGGAEALGVFSVSHTTLGVVLPLAGLGLSTLTLYRAAERADPAQLGARHGMYLMATTAAFVVVALTISPLGGVVALSFVATLWLLPALGQSWAGLSFAHGRGLARPQREIVAGLLGAGVLAIGTLMAGSLQELGLACAASMLVFCAAVLHAVRKEPALMPRTPSWKEVRGAVAASRGYFAVDALLFALSTLDLFAVQFSLGAAGTGMLNAATVLPRNAAFVPLFVSLLAIGGASVGQPRIRPRLLAFAALALWLIAAPIAWLLLPALSRAYALELSPLQPTALAALLSAPALFLMVALVPLAVAENVREALAGLCAGLAVAALGALVATPSHGAVGAVLAVGLGQLVAAAWAAVVLSRASGKGAG
ncbi:MAG TPA: hypothetical protein PKA88_03675 [Polyangiaceae bacterium]|nr:hypothetical protein [Polyangiaceae bacterium]